METDLEQRASTLGEVLRARQYYLATAESCTGGWVATEVTAIPGSSQWFDRGFVTYTNLSKHQLLGVAPETLDAHGAVSEAVAREMAEGALARSGARVSLAVTGIAGPGGGTPEKPVGTVWFAWAGTDRATVTRKLRFEGDRRSVRQQSVAAALEGMVAFVDRAD